MKLTNVHYEYRGNDIWRIYFKDYQEADAFRNGRTDEQKAQIAMLLPIFTNGKGVRYCVEAKLEGQFNILRHYAKNPTNDYFSNDIWRALVKKIEGADSDYIFDEIDLWYDATIDKCYFKICCMNGTWTDLFVKNMLNSQFGMVAQANGYSDTDTVGEGGLCTRRSCCGIGFYPNTYKTAEERIMFTVKNFCRGEADIIKVGAWTSTFIGTNKEDEKEYSWRDFKHHMGLLHANGSDIWDIEWKYDAACQMTGTEIADELHLYLKPLAYKRLFDKKEKEEDDLLKNITDVSLSGTKTIGCSTLYYYNLYFDDWSDLKYVSNRINRNMFDYFKGAYYIRVVSYNKELPKNSTNATQKKEAKNKEEKNMGPKETSLKDLHRRLYWGYINTVKPTKILVQGTATIIWWSDGTKTIVKCQKGDKMDPEKGIAMCVMKKFMGTNETHSNYLDFAKDAIAEYEKHQAAEKAKKKAEADKKRREAAKKKGAAGNANYKRTTKKHPIETLSDAITALAKETNAGKEES